MPITDAMKTGKEPMRTFGDVVQFYEAKKQEPPEDRPVPPPAAEGPTAGVAAPEPPVAPPAGVPEAAEGPEMKPAAAEAAPAEPPAAGPPAAEPKAPDPPSPPS